MTSLSPGSPVGFKVYSMVETEREDEESAEIRGVARSPNSRTPTRSRSYPATTGGIRQSKRLDRSSGESTSRIRVVVRKRPISFRETDNEERDIASVDCLNRMLAIYEPKTKVDLTKYEVVHKFRFDDVFDEHTTNHSLYEKTAKSLVSAIFEGAKVTCFAYGQTGSGKSHTMMGPSSKKEPGLYAMAAEDIFRQLNVRDSRDLIATVSFFEIYGKKLFDLFNGRKQLVSRVDGNQHVRIVGLREMECETVDYLLELIESGSESRSTGSTGANIDSSRSHAVLQIKLRNRHTGSQHGMFSFIDLAGSERGVDTLNQDRKTRIEGAEINKSLLALKECIRAQDQKLKHVPFRGSVLTQVLKDSFVGHCQTIMIANISPNSGSCEHTLNTLRYADRVKELKKSANFKGSVPSTTPKVNAYMPHTLTSGTVAKPLRSPSDPDERRELLQTHEKMVSALLEEEEHVIQSHRQHIDEFMKVMRDEMDLLKRFDELGCGVDEYVTNLDKLLVATQTSTSRLRHQLSTFKANLEQEESLSKTLTCSPKLT